MSKIRNLILIDENFKNNIHLVGENIIFYNSFDFKKISKWIKDFDRVFVLGENLQNVFIKCSKVKGFVVSYVFNICDAIEPFLFSDVNLCLFDLSEISVETSLQLLEICIKQPKRSDDGYHDVYVSNLYERGADQFEFDND